MAVVAADQADDLRTAISSAAGAVLRLIGSFDAVCAREVESGEQQEWQRTLILVACALRGVEVDAESLRESTRALASTFVDIDAAEWAAGLRDVRGAR